MNLIIKNNPKIKWYTDLQPFVASLGDKVNNYYWIFDNVDTMASFPNRSEEDGVWKLSGDQLKDLVQNRPQFIWSVVSAIPVQKSESLSLKGDRPFADGNQKFWIGSPKPQLFHAEFEIVCWDSSLTLLIGANEDISKSFLKAYPGALSLDEENAKR